jgi:hypothetical protein
MMDDIKQEQEEWGNDDKVIFIPMEDIQAFEHILQGLEEVQKEFRKVQEGMKPMEHGE